MKMSPGRFPHRIRSAKLETLTAEVQRDLDDLVQRLHAVAGENVNLGLGPEPVVPAESREEVLRLVKLPETFLFLKVEWPSPYWGLQVCIRWEKPRHPRRLVRDP